MRKPSPTTLAAAAAIALFAQAADAQTRGAASAGRVSAGPKTSQGNVAVIGTPIAGVGATGVNGVAPMDGLGTDTGIAGSGDTQVVILNPKDLAGSVTSTPELDRATRKELDKAKAASRSRNKQLLNTIAPRTNVDRTAQMADDPPSPALSTPERSLPRY